MKEQCNILFPRDDFRDVSGCLKPHGHIDWHVCETGKGTRIAWKDDGSCECGCWDEFDKGDGNVCIVYFEYNEKIERKENNE